MTQFQLILLAMTGLESAVKLVNGLITAAKQKSELTPAEDAQLRARQRDIMGQAHWLVQPDPTNKQ